MAGQVSPHAVRPSDVLRDELAARGWSVVDLTNRSGLAQGAVQALLAGELPIDGAVSLALARALDTAPQFWREVQQDYDRRLAAKQGPGPGLEAVYRLRLTLASGHEMCLAATSLHVGVAGDLSIGVWLAGDESAPFCIAPGAWRLAWAEAVSCDGGQTWEPVVMATELTASQAEHLPGVV